MKYKVLRFTAPWCQPCKLLEPIMERMQEEFPDRFEVEVINVDTMTDSANTFSVRSVPTLIMLKDGHEVNRISQTTGITQIRDFISQGLRR